MLESTYEGHNVYEIPVELGRSPKIPGSMRRIMLNDGMNQLKRLDMTCASQSRWRKAGLQ
jgi:hypothetical protein